MKKKVLIFGATGNIGLYLSDYLKKKLPNEYEIIAIGRKNTNYFKTLNIDYLSIDINKKDEFKKLPIEDVYAIIHLAGLLPARMEGYDPELYIQTNIIGTLNILEYAKSVGADRFLFMKSISDYHGYLPQRNFFPSDLPAKLKYTGDHTVYAISKCAAADLVEHYYQEYRIKRFIFRLPNIYMFSSRKFYFENGKKKLISYRYLIDQAINGQDIELWGNPAKGIDVVYVKDFTQIIYKALLTDINGGTYNVGSGKLTSMQDFVTGIIKVFSDPNNISKIIYCPEKKDCANFLMDISKTEKELGYIPQYDYLSFLEDYKRELQLNRFSKS